MELPVKKINIVAIFALLLLVGCGKAPEAENRVLRLYAGAGLRRGVDAVVSAFEKDTGIKVEPDYGGSGMIISRAREDSEADLFMPGDVWYVDRLQEKAQLIESKTAIAFFVPVIIVAKGNPKKITGLKDFFRDDLKVAVGNPKACQVGRLTRKIFENSGLDISKLNTKESLTVNELGVWVKMNDVDISIVWDAIAANIANDIEEIVIPKEKNIISNVVIGLMTTSKDKVSAQRFIDFLVSDKGRAILKEKGYRTEAP
jgi:molybdate transport system substrate-binding protein